MIPFRTPLMLQKALAASAGISYVGGGTVSCPGSTTVGGSISLTALTGGSGSAPLQNDYVVVVVSQPRVSPSNLTMALVSSGYTKLADYYNSDNSDSNVGIFIKKMGATPDTTVDIPPSGHVTYAIVACAQVFRGVDLTTPLDVAIVQSGGSDSTLVNPNGITPVTAGAWIVACGGSSAQGGTGSIAGNYSASDLTNFIRNFGTYCNCGMGYRVWSGSGAYDPVAWTNSGGTNIRSAWCAGTLALRPA